MPKLIGERKFPRTLIFEGPDPVARSELAKMAAAKLASRNLNVRYLPFPDTSKGIWGSLVCQLHVSDCSPGTISPTSFLLVEIASHLNSIDRLTYHKRTVFPSFLVLDRFWWSTWVHGKLRGIPVKLLQRIVDIEQEFWKRADLPSVVFVSPDNSGAKANNRIRAALLYKQLVEREKIKRPIHAVNSSVQLDLILSKLWDNEPMKTPGANALGTPSLFKQELHEPLFYAWNKLTPAQPTAIFDTYWRFAAERQAIFFRRFKEEYPPWTADPVLLHYKFTNAYRASDRVSQYLIRHVLYNGDQSPHELLFRLLLFKIFNKIETWDALKRRLGSISWKDYSYKEYDRLLSEILNKGDRIYSAAYIMASPSPYGHNRKHKNHLKLIETIMEDQTALRLAEAENMREVFDILKAYPSIGDFLAYQFATDINYSTLTQFSEMEFVVPGPGALDGLKKCFKHFGGLGPSDVIRLVADTQESHFERLGLSFQNLWGRNLQLIDCQNLFCEVDKYSRVVHPEATGISGRTRIKQRFRAMPTPIDYWYPPKWGVNERITDQTKDG